MFTPSPKPPSCPPKAPLAERPLLDVEKANELMRLFEVLASDTRLRLLHAIVLLDEPCMSEIADAVGMKIQAVSNQLRRMVDMGILATKRQGNFVHYRIVDNCITKLIYHGLCLNEETQARSRRRAGAMPSQRHSGGAAS